MDITKAILTFVLQSEDYPESEVNRKLHNKYRGYIDKLYGKCTTSVGLSSRGDTRYDITYIAFLNHGQNVKEGIYPVMLYFRKIKKIVFAYGVSATNESSANWDWGLIGAKVPMTLKELFEREGWDTYDKYFESFVYSYYDLEDFVKKYRGVDITALTTIVEAAGFGFKHDIDTLIEHFDRMFGVAKTPVGTPIGITPIIVPVVPTRDDFSIKKVIEYIDSTGLQYTPNLIKRFAFSLMTKPFVILSGLAGSGKTQLALVFAKALVEDKSQICTVAVGADWTNREPLLGYPNALDSAKYVSPESGVLDLLIEASKPENRHKPYFLILDEMNMSYVERYFADFLSGMESSEPIKLWNNSVEGDVPKEITLPKNLYIVGTINVDETTYMFSPKVLDRASVIEFKISVKDMTTFLSKISDVDSDGIYRKASTMAEDFVEKTGKASVTLSKDTSDTLVAFFTELKSVNAEFGYRAANEIYKYIEIVAANDEEKKMTPNEVLDSAIVQKLLPKLHGSRKKLTPALKALWRLCCPDSNLDDAKAVPEGAKYPLSADKILRMYLCAVDNGFTSFSEA